MFTSFFPTSFSKVLAPAAAVAALWLCAAPLHALAQVSAEQDFPADAQTLSASELDTRLRGKVYTATLASGVGWRGDYKASGYVFANTTNGVSDTGKWRTEDGKVCVEYRGRMRSACNEVRAIGQALYVKNSAMGVVTVLQPD